MEWHAKWIKSKEIMTESAPVFAREFTISGEVAEAKLWITAMGIYEAKLNGKRIGEFVLAPGWTSYTKRLQYQEYDITDLIQSRNQIRAIVGRGWYHGRMPGDIQEELTTRPIGLLAQLKITYTDGRTEIIGTDERWNVSESEIRLSELYDGEIFDATFEASLDKEVEVFDGPSDTLIPQEGEEIREQERVAVAKIIKTPKEEFVVDFGQEITGYVEISVDAKAGEVVKLSFGEVLDKEGNFYNENYRSAKCNYHYTCCEGRQTYHPRLTFYGFRYVRVDDFPGGVANVKPENFVAIVVYSQMRRTGYLSCSNPLLNKFFENVVWGQKDNFLDVPTDCPQRDERLGWTGDAQVFIRTACMNFDVERFFTKWLKDLAADQMDDGGVGTFIPDTRKTVFSAGWGDASTICPWEIYLAYGNSQILENQYESMKKWVDYITTHTKKQYLWTGCVHYGDWLGLDAPSGSYKGSSRQDLIASAYYAKSTLLLTKAGKVLGKDVREYEVLYDHIVEAFQVEYPEYMTQTECAIAVHFRLARDCQETSNQLAHMVQECGTKLQTGFVGTPYLLHALSDYGHSELAYSLLLRKDYPSWLYPVTKGATTIWEHWDSIMENGDFWSSDMNSFNHYAYGAVTDWVYGVAAGIQPIEETPGYERVRIAPVPDKRLDWLKCSLETRHGEIRSEWKKQENVWRYEITTPVPAQIIIDENEYEVKAGTYCFYSREECHGRI